VGETRSFHLQAHRETTRAYGGWAAIARKREGNCRRKRYLFITISNKRSKSGRFAAGMGNDEKNAIQEVKRGGAVISAIQGREVGESCKVDKGGRCRGVGEAERQAPEDD